MPKQVQDYLHVSGKLRGELESSMIREEDEVVNSNTSEVRTRMTDKDALARDRMSSPSCRLRAQKKSVSDSFWAQAWTPRESVLLPNTPLTNAHHR